MFSFIRNHHAVFHTGCMICMILNSYISYCIISSPTSDALSVLDFDHSNLCVVIFSCHFNVHFPVTNDVKCMFMLICHVYIFLDRVSVKVFGLFYNWVVLSFIDCAFGIMFKEATHCIISSTWHSGKENQWLPGVRKEEGMNRQSTEGL